MLMGYDGWSFRRVQRLLFSGSLAGSVIYGAQGLLWWLLVPPLAFAINLYAEDRSVRRRIGQAAWASPGYARFLFGTNLFLLVKSTFLACAAFTAAGMMAQRLAPLLA